jgi:hypothetical protein
MALTYINLTGFQGGVAADETGINIKTFKTDVEPEFKNLLQGKTGEVRGFGVAPMKKIVTIDGEVSGSTGVMAATATAAFTPANSSSYFGAPATSLYLDKGSVTENRENGAWKEVSTEFSAYAGIS